MSYTAKQLEEALEALEDQELTYTYLQWRTNEPKTGTEQVYNVWNTVGDEVGFGGSFDLENFGRVSVVNAETGGEGEGEHCEIVLRVEGADGFVRYFEKNGYYASFHGTDWDGSFFEVLPEQKMITVYKPIPKAS